MSDAIKKFVRRALVDGRDGEECERLELQRIDATGKGQMLQDWATDDAEAEELYQQITESAQEDANGVGEAGYGVIARFPSGKWRSPQMRLKSNEESDDDDWSADAGTTSDKLVAQCMRHVQQSHRTMINAMNYMSDFSTAHVQALVERVGYLEEGQLSHMKAREKALDRAADRKLERKKEKMKMEALAAGAEAVKGLLPAVKARLGMKINVDSAGDDAIGALGSALLESLEPEQVQALVNAGVLKPEQLGLLQEMQRVHIVKLEQQEAEKQQNGKDEN